MKRRCIAVVGMIALALAYLPGMVGVLSANTSTACCAGMMCPLRHMSGGHMDCGMDMSHPGTTCEACAPHHPLPYTSGAVFNRVAPPPVSTELPAGMAPVLLQIASSSLKLEVVSPPPRLALS